MQTEVDFFVLIPLVGTNPLQQQLMSLAGFALATGLLLHGQMEQIVKMLDRHHSAKEAE